MSRTAPDPEVDHSYEVGKGGQFMFSKARKLFSSSRTPERQVAEEQKTWKKWKQVFA